MRCRFLGSQLLHRRGRTLTLGAGILVAAAAFSLLTAAVSTSELRVRGAVAKNWRTAYDILVRPRRSFTPLERRAGLVRENYLSGIFGGISLRQYHAIERVPGVAVAAPIANVGFVAPFGHVPVSIESLLTRGSVQLYRVRFRWLADGGLSRYPAGDAYIYYERRHRLTFQWLRGFGDERFPSLPEEKIAGGRRLPVCSGFPASLPARRGPFDFRADSWLACFSSRSPQLWWLNYFDSKQRAAATHDVGTLKSGYFPMLLSAIDPVAEARLVHLDRAVTSGRYLREGDRPRVRRFQGFGNRFVPVVVSTKTFVDAILEARVERLRIPAGARVPQLLAAGTCLSHTEPCTRELPAPAGSGYGNAYDFLTSLEGPIVATKKTPFRTAYERMLSGGRVKGLDETGTNAYWTASPVRYREVGRARLAASQVRSFWKEPLVETGFDGTVPPENADTQFRRVAPHVGSHVFGEDNILNSPAFEIVGRFDPARLPGFSPLTRVPLETYYPPVAEAGDAATNRALRGKPLLPTPNLGGYIQQPPLMLTTLDGLRAFTNSQYFQGASAKAPISVIRVRVAGATGPDAFSRERVRRVAADIHDRTGLAVDITAGSSPHPLLINLPEGKFGRPPLVLREGWVKKGVAVAFLTALDRKSLAVFLLVLVVCVFFLVNGALASVRSRRAEIGTLLCLGWSRQVIFGAVLGELAFVGLAAGLVGAALAAVLVAVLGLDLALWRAALVAPVAVVLAVAAGLVPAWRAARSVPLDAIRPPVSERSGRALPGLAGMALANLLRLPIRTALASAGLFVGVASLAVLLSLQLAFQGLLADTLLGEFISVQIRPVDYLSVALAIALGGLAVADVLALNLRERAPELVTLRASGWRERHLARVVSLEGLGIGLLGSGAGALVGFLVGGLVLEGPLGRVAGLSALAALAGVLVAVLASLVPASFVGRMTMPRVLAEE